ncbi:MAG: hypothetical protein ACP5JN_04240 [Candidatus Micrarchaeia archaeon]
MEEEKDQIKDQISRILGTDKSIKPAKDILYKPKTKFLKEKIAKAHFSNKKERKYIDILCSREEFAYKYEVKGESFPMYGSKKFLCYPEYDEYREEYLRMLDELSHEDYIRVMAEEIFLPDHRPDKNPPKLEDFSEEDRKKILEWKKRYDEAEKRIKEKEAEKRRREEEEHKRWWLSVGGNE